MPKPIVITIVRKPDGKIQPQEDSATAGVRTKVQPNTPIEFRPGGGATNVSVSFSGESPFGDNPQDRQNVGAGTIRKAFNANNPGANVYSYHCQ
jgi:hypothetical protein